ncbi:MAG: hypothetical protein ACPGJV_02720 [Bacteriovoracaceae bacterium]
MKKGFSVLHFNGTTYQDNSLAAGDFGGVSFDSTLLIASELLVGLYKPFRFFYVEIKTPHTVNANISFEYFDSESNDWKELSVLDETLGLTQSGFVQLVNLPESWINNEVDSLSKYWIRIKTDTDLDLLEVQGLGIVFSNDADLIEEKSDIVTDDNRGKSWILKHQAARKDIVRIVRSWSNKKTEDEIKFEDINEYDLRLDQVRNASKYLTLSKIYKNDLSGSNEDSYFHSAIGFQKNSNESLRQDLISIDLNDDGIEDANEDSPVVISSGKIL